MRARWSVIFIAVVSLVSADAKRAMSLPTMPPARTVHESPQPITAKDFREATPSRLLRYTRFASIPFRREHRVLLESFQIAAHLVDDQHDSNGPLIVVIGVAPFKVGIGMGNMVFSPKHEGIINNYTVGRLSFGKEPFEHRLKTGTLTYTPNNKSIANPDVVDRVIFLDIGKMVRYPKQLQVACILEEFVHVLMGIYDEDLVSEEVARLYDGVVFKEGQYFAVGPG